MNDCRANSTNNFTTPLCIRPQKTLLVSKGEILRNERNMSCVSINLTAKSLHLNYWQHLYLTSSSAAPLASTFLSVWVRQWAVNRHLIVSLQSWVALHAASSTLLWKTEAVSIDYRGSLKQIQDLLRSTNQFQSTMNWIVITPAMQCLLYIKQLSRFCT